MRRLFFSLLGAFMISSLVGASDLSEIELNALLEGASAAQETDFADVESATKTEEWDEQKEENPDFPEDAFVSFFTEESEVLTDPLLVSFEDMVAFEDEKRYAVESEWEYLEGYEDKAELSLVLTDAGEGLAPEKEYLRCESSDTTHEGNFLIPLQGSPEETVPEITLTIDGKSYAFVPSENNNPEENLEYHALDQEENFIYEAITLRFLQGLLKREEYVKIHEDGMEKVATAFALELEIDALTFSRAEMTIPFNYIHQIETTENQLTISLRNETEELDKRELFTRSDQIVEENLPIIDAPIKKEEIQTIKMK